MGILHAPAFLKKNKNKEPHNYRIPGQFSRNVVDIWSGPFWKQPSHEAQTDWLTPFAKLQPAHPPCFTQNKKARERLLSRVQSRVYVHLPSQHLHFTPSSSLDGLSCSSFGQQGFLFSEPQATPTMQGEKASETLTFPPTLMPL